MENIHKNIKKHRCSYLKEKAKADPLVISDISPLLRVYSLVNARVSNINTNPLPEGTGDGVGGVDPAVRVQHVLGDFLGVNTVYGVSHILARCGDDRKCQEEGNCGGVVEPEYAGVYYHAVGLHQPLKTTEHVQHGLAGTSTLVLNHKLLPKTITWEVSGFTYSFCSTFEYVLILNRFHSVHFQILFS